MTKPVARDVVALYVAMRDDDRLQKNWEQNQPRTDRALESVLIGSKTSREIATAALLAAKLRLEPAAARLVDVEPSSGLNAFAKEAGGGSTRLAAIVREGRDADPEAFAAAVYTLEFYRDRSAFNELVRLSWSTAALKALAVADPEAIINNRLRPTYSKPKAACLKELAELLTSPEHPDDETLLRRLRQLPRVGSERADAIGVFAFQKPWPIVDEYLWGLLARHGVLKEEERDASSYERRRRLFEPHWQELLSAKLDEPSEVAATL